jgi:hypothetical protein
MRMRYWGAERANADCFNFRDRRGRNLLRPCRGHAFDGNRAARPGSPAPLCMASLLRGRGLERCVESLLYFGFAPQALIRHVDLHEHALGVT